MKITIEKTTQEHKMEKHYIFTYTGIKSRKTGMMHTCNVQRRTSGLKPNQKRGYFPTDENGVNLSTVHCGLESNTKLDLWNQVLNFLLENNTACTLEANTVFYTLTKEIPSKPHSVFSGPLTSKQVFSISSENWNLTELLNHESFSHVRMSEYWKDSVLVYFTAINSPSKVLMAGSGKLSDIPENFKGVISNSGPTRGEIASKKWSI